MEKFQDYWREGYPLLDRLVFRPITESSTRAAAIRTGDVDIVNRLSPTDAISLGGVDGVNLVEYSNNRVYYIALNNLTSGVGQPTENVLVRQAMNYAVDKEGIIAALFEGKGAVPTALLVSGDVGYDDSVEPYAYDPEKAKELLTEAGFGDGFSIGMACPSDAYTNFSEVCEAVAAQLGEVGIDAQLDIMESGTFWDLEAEKQLPPLFGDSWSANSNEPSAYDRLFGALGGRERQLLVVVRSGDRRPAQQGAHHARRHRQGTGLHRHPDASARGSAVHLPVPAGHDRGDHRPRRRLPPTQRRGLRVVVHVGHWLTGRR